jgi:hypothetical protein
MLMSRPINTTLWQQLSQDVTTEMRAWRLAHPKATLREIELALDARLNQMRARMIEDLALAGSAADWAATPAVVEPGRHDGDAGLAARPSEGNASRD